MAEEKPTFLAMLVPVFVYVQGKMIIFLNLKLGFFLVFSWMSSSILLWKYVCGQIIQTSLNLPQKVHVETFGWLLCFCSVLLHNSWSVNIELEEITLDLVDSIPACTRTLRNTSFWYKLEIWVCNTLIFGPINPITLRKLLRLISVSPEDVLNLWII